MKKAYRRASELLRAADTVAVIGHLRPDADAIGSVVALTLGLRQLGKRVTPMVGQLEPLPANLLTIPEADTLLLGGEIPADADLLVAVDCGSLDRTGVLADQVADRQDQLLVIDHHASNPGYGAYNLVDHVESTTTILYPLLQDLGVEITPDIAHALYAGLVTDTGSFRWGTSRMHELAAQLVGYGIDARRIAEDLLDRISIQELQMIGSVLAGLQILDAGDYRLAVLVVDRENMEKQEGAGVDKLIDFVRALDGCDIGVVFKQQAHGGWAASLRSTVVDVSRLAQGLGGGGHVAAAGYSTWGEVTEIVRELHDAVTHHQET